MVKKYKLGLYEKAMPGNLSWNTKFSTARKVGYDYLEISIDETDEKLTRLNWNSKEVYKLGSIAKDEGMSIGSMCLSGHRRFPLGGKDDKKSLEIMENAINFACEANIPVIQLAGYDVFYEKSTPETVEKFLINLDKSVKMASREGILLGFETMETSFMDTVKKVMKYVKTINSPFLGVYPDIGNLNNSSYLYNIDVCNDLETGKGHIFAVHIKETVPGKYREIPFGKGKVDFEKFLSKTWEMGVRRYVTELWDTGEKNWQERISEAFSLSNGILNKFN